VANTRLKVVLFSFSCGRSVRVAGKGLTGRKLTVDSSKWKGRGSGLNAETLSAERGKKSGEGEVGGLERDESTG
jgi:hypothetical protein